MNKKVHRKGTAENKKVYLKCQTWDLNPRLYLPVV